MDPILKLIELAGLSILTEQDRKDFNSGERDVVGHIGKTIVATAVTGAVIVTVAPSLGLLTIPIAYGFSDYFSKKN